MCKSPVAPDHDCPIHNRICALPIKYQSQVLCYLWDDETAHYIPMDSSPFDDGTIPNDEEEWHIQIDGKRWKLIRAPRFK